MACPKCLRAKQWNVKLMEESRLQKILASSVFKSFLLFAIFRAFYGAGILIVTWFLATESEGPWWLSIIFLACSMVFSRILFKWIKSLKVENNLTEITPDMSD
jgi:hypothetical protein